MLYFLYHLVVQIQFWFCGLIFPNLNFSKSRLLIYFATNEERRKLRGTFVHAATPEIPMENGFLQPSVLESLASLITPGRVLNLPRSRYAISFANITCSQKETAESHALSLRTWLQSCYEHMGVYWRVLLNEGFLKESPPSRSWAFISIIIIGHYFLFSK